MLTKTTYKQSGQAMTESVIAASFVLVPLFLLIPLLGKYIDLHQTAIQAARYEAWEYTVWYSDQNEVPLNAVDNTGTQLRSPAIPVKNIATLQAESRLRFFSREAHSRNAIERDLIGEGTWNISDANPFWQDHADNSLLANTTSINSTLVSNNNTPGNATTNNPNFDNPLEIDWRIWDAATGAGSAIAGFITGARPSTTSLTRPAFDVNRFRGYSRTQLQIPVTSQPGLINFGSISGTYGRGTVANTFNFIFGGNAAVLSDGWNA
ncbi:MAG: hypothetical protein MI865_08275, partial [Proteobacteria bacterium]|nr:hypothetical protein [Pseudomonadota bacterium]